MQTDVKSTKVLSSTGAFVDQNNNNITVRTRLKGLYVLGGATAGTVTITSGAETLTVVSTPASATYAVYILLPGEGILAENGLSATIANATSVVAYYG